MDAEIQAMRDALIQNILDRQDAQGCWNVLPETDPRYPDFNYYSPAFNSTLWTLLLLAELKTPPKERLLRAPLTAVTRKFLDKEHGIFSIGKSHFPIPCLNGNMLYLNAWFGTGEDSMVQGVVEFFHRYQRFDDGDFMTPSAFPYCRNKSCYGQHSCYWGVVKLMKGLSFLPPAQRSPEARALLDRCIDYVLLHQVCYSSRREGELLHKGIDRLAFPGLYRADFLEILWILKREGVDSPRMHKALELLKSKEHADGRFPLERKERDLLVSVGAKDKPNPYVTERAREVLYGPGCAERF